MRLLDLKDRKILFELDMNARLPITQIAKRVKVSPQVVEYRMQNLEKRGFIRGYRALIDIAKLGFLTYRIYFRYENVTPQKEKEILDYFRDHPYVIWYIGTSGRFDLEVLFLARNFIHFNQITRDILKKYNEYLRNSVTSVSISNFHHRKFWLIDAKANQTQVFYGGEPFHESLDKTDVNIINLLSTSARISYVDIAQKLQLVPNAVKYRIKNIHKKGIIQAYRTWIDTFKIGIQWYKALITFKYLDDEIERKILEFCKQEPQLLYCVMCIGPWNVEIEVEVPDNQTFREIMIRFRNLFRELILDYQTLQVHSEYKMDYFPIKKLEWV